MPKIEKVIIENRTTVDLWIYWVGVPTYKLLIWIADSQNPPANKNSRGRMLKKTESMYITLIKWIEFNGLVINTSRVRKMQVRIREQKTARQHRLTIKELLN